MQLSFFTDPMDATDPPGRRRRPLVDELPAGRLLATEKSVLGNAESISQSTLEHSPEQNPVSRRSGWLEPYTVKSGRWRYEYTRYCWRDGYRGRTHRRHLRPYQVAEVRQAIANHYPVEHIEQLITGR